MYLDEAEEVLDQYPHLVEYLSAGDSEIRVEHVQIADEVAAPAAKSTAATAG
jgi:hypothetical protein